MTTPRIGERRASQEELHPTSILGEDPPAIEEVEHGPFGLVLVDPTYAAKRLGNAQVLPQLQVFLEGLVPLAISEFRTKSAAFLDEQRLDALDQIAHHGDVLLYGGRGATEARTALAKALAICAFQPGGVTALGIHACTRQHEGCPGSRKSPIPHQR